MGWTSIKHSGDILEDLKKTMIGNNFELLQHSIKSNAVYTAIKNKTTDNIFACVFLYSIKNGEIQFKDVCESEGPFYYDCPKKIIKILSPTDNENALDWRKRCSLNPKVGEKITFINSKISCEGKEYDEFIYMGKNLFKPINEDFCIRINTWKSYI